MCPLARVNFPLIFPPQWLIRSKDHKTLCFVPQVGTKHNVCIGEILGYVFSSFQVKHGEIVPEEYYLSKSNNRLSNQPGVQKLTVSRMSKANINFDVKEPGSNIEWEFETAARDIGFKLLYKNSKCDSTKELVPNQRVDTQLMSEAGMYQCEWPGTCKYILFIRVAYIYVNERKDYNHIWLQSSKYNVRQPG